MLSIGHQPHALKQLTNKLRSMIYTASSLDEKLVKLMLGHGSLTTDGWVLAGSHGTMFNGDW